MGTLCYAQVRGSVIRLTRLSSDGSYAAGSRSTLVSRNVTRITVNEVTSEKPGIEERAFAGEGLRLYAPSVPEVVHYETDIEFNMTDPDAVEIVTGQPVVTDSLGDVIGFESRVRGEPVSFALEIWSRLVHPVKGYGFGYTILPHLRGGVLSGFSVENGNLLSFAVKGAATYANSKWGKGPYTLYSPAGTGGWDAEPPPLGWDDLPWDTAVWGASPACGPESLSTDTRLPFTVGPDLIMANLLTQGAPEPSCGAKTLTPVTS